MKEMFMPPAEPSKIEMVDKMEQDRRIAEEKFGQIFNLLESKTSKELKRSAEYIQVQKKISALLEEVRYRNERDLLDSI